MAATALASVALTPIVMKMNIVTPTIHAGGPRVAAGMKTLSMTSAQPNVILLAGGAMMLKTSQLVRPTMIAQVKNTVIPGERVMQSLPAVITRIPSTENVQPRVKDARTTMSVPVTNTVIPTPIAWMPNIAATTWMALMARAQQLLTVAV